MASLEERLAAGLLAQDWDQTAARGPWRRFGKFGRGAMYIALPGFAEWCCDAACKAQHMSGYEVLHVAPALWFSELCETQPRYPVVGPILQQILAAGDAVLATERPDTEAMLIELMYLADGAPDGQA